jgi:hypothetical protein
MRIPTLALPQTNPIDDVVQRELQQLTSLQLAASTAPDNPPPSSISIHQLLDGAIRRPSDELLGRFIAIVEARRNDYAETRPQIQRFFFVSWNGVIQIYDSRVHNLESVQGSHVFSNAGYITAALRENSVRSTALANVPGYAIASERSSSMSRCSIPSAFGVTRAVSRVYLDLLGSGAVATVCYPVRSNGPGKIGGVFCADLSLPRRVMNGGAQEGRGLTGLLIDTDRSTMSDDDEYQFRQSDGSPVDMDRCSDESDGLSGDRSAGCPRRAARTWADRRRADRSAIDPVRGAGKADEFVAITWKGRIGNHRLMDVTVVTSPRSNARLWIAMLVALVFGTLSVALVVVRRQQDDEQLRLAIVEGLHVGVLISSPEERRSRRAVDEGELAVLTDEDRAGDGNYREFRIESHDSRIVTMNDRAEELFWVDRRPSWKSGVTWWSSLIMRHPNDPSVLACFDQDKKLISLAQIAKLRARGESSTYFIAARYTPMERGCPTQWIKVSGSVALPSKTSFAVIEEVTSSKDCAELNRAFLEIHSSRFERSEAAK